jgi:hypothetical protein
MGYSYFPILKTTDAELKAYEHLDDSVKEKILPIFELTRSRKSSKNIDRSIYKRLDKIEELCLNRPFILDLTADTQLSNDQIKDILNSPKDGFPLWVDLIRNINERKLKVIPVIHYNPNFIDDVAKEVNELQKISNLLAFRVDIDDSDLEDYLLNLQKIYPLKNLILILDAKFIDCRKVNGDALNVFSSTIDRLLDTFGHKAFAGILCAFSCFPDSVTKYGNDQYGCFPRLEKATFFALKKYYDNTAHIYHSDYASVHPIRYDTAGGQWIPRIDFFDESNTYYYRFRRENGGYVSAAQKTVKDLRYVPIKEYTVWADNEIEAAARGKPNGSNPSHWISCRINLYISKIVTELKEEDQMVL